MILPIFESAVSQMTANGDTFTSLHADKDWQNLVSDESTLPAVYLDMPVRYRPEQMAGGGIKKRYLLVAMFLYKSELDHNPTQRNSRMNKCEAAQINFQNILYSMQGTSIKEFSVGECYQLMNVFDLNADAVVMPFEIVPDEWNAICV